MSAYMRVDQDLKLVVSFVVLDILALLSILLRFWGISIQNAKIKTHDLLCVFSFVTLVGYSIALAIGTVDGGIGLHIYDVSGAELVVGLKSFFASQFLWGLSICAFRLAILLLYIDVFGGTLWFRRVAWLGLLIVCLFYVGALTTTLRLCQPVAFNWDLTLDGSCGDEGVAQLAAAAINMVIDVGIVALPLPIVWGLHMRTSQKIGIVVTFGLGLFIAGINLARIVLVLTCNVKSDFTYCTLDSAILTVAEMAVGIMVACVPRMGPVFRRSREVGSSAAASHGPLRPHGPKVGRDYSGNNTQRIMKTQESTLTETLRPEDMECAESSVVGNKQTYYSPLQASIQTSGGAELDLETARGSGTTHVFATFVPDISSGKKGEGIAVTQNFGVSEVNSMSEGSRAAR